VRFLKNVNILDILLDFGVCRVALRKNTVRQSMLSGDDTFQKFAALRTA
jgi:hypothetical protein